MIKGPKIVAKISGLPKDYSSMPFGRQMDYNGLIRDFKSSAKVGYLGTKRKSVASALAEFKKLYDAVEWYFVDTTSPTYKDDSIQIWYKTPAQTNPRPPITRQWKPMLVRTNAAGQVQVAPTERSGYGFKPKRVSLGATKKRRAIKRKTTTKRNGPLDPFDSILNSFGFSGPRPGTTTRDSTGEILRSEYRNGPGKSITIIADRRGSGKPSYAWISNGPILPAHSGVRSKQTLATLKRTLKAHLKKMDKR